MGVKYGENSPFPEENTGEKYFGGKYHVKLGHFGGKYRVKFGPFVNFSYT